MIGPRHNPNVSCKAAEALGLLEFSVWILDKYKDKLPPLECGLLLESGKAAVEVIPINLRILFVCVFNGVVSLQDTFCKGAT